MRLFCIQVGEQPRDDERFALMRSALIEAYAAARYYDEPVQVFETESEDEDAVFTALAVVSALPIGVAS